MQLQKFARSMRNNPTDAEHLLWQHLRCRKVEGFRFRRQVVIDPYIVDFVCFEAKLIIEVDGGQHQLQAEKDIYRDIFLTQRGYSILRFWNNEVISNIEGVIEKICLHLITPP